MRRVTIRRTVRPRRRSKFTGLKKSRLRDARSQGIERAMRNASELRLILACERLLAAEKVIRKMPKAQQDWFMGKPGHQDSFLVAKALKKYLLGTAE